MLLETFLKTTFLQPGGVFLVFYHLDHPSNQSGNVCCNVYRITLSLSALLAFSGAQACREWWVHMGLDCGFKL